MVVAFAFNYIYTAIDARMQPDTFWVMQMASSRAQFWFLLLLTSVATLLPR